MSQKQLLMCIANARASVFNPQILAHKGSVYTYRDSTKCECGDSFVQVEEVQHDFDTCVGFGDWLPGKCFVPLNDPKLDEKPETYETDVPGAPPSRPVPLVVD